MIALEDLSSLPAPSLLQSELWARFKSEYGWSANAFSVTEGPWTGTTILVLCRTVAPGVRLAYVPYAPPFVDGSVQDLPRLAEAISDSLDRPSLVRFDLDWESEVSPAGLTKSPVDVQPASTVLLDLRLSLDELLASMHKKNRYNIRLSERKGVRVERSDGKAVAEWYRLYLETARRDRITIHPQHYYRRLFELAELDSHAEITLYSAFHESDLLAGIIVVRVGKTATYLYGASSNTKRELMPNYALQWEAIREAQAAGCEVYDLFGVPPAADSSHPMHGLYRFKTGFGGQVVNRAGAWDYTDRPVRYRAYVVAERLRSFYFHRMRKAGAR